MIKHTKYYGKKNHEKINIYYENWLYNLYYYCLYYKKKLFGKNFDKFLISITRIKCDSITIKPNLINFA